MAADPIVQKNLQPIVVLCATNVPKRPTNTNRLFSLGLLYLRAAAERAGWECHLVDAYFDDLSARDCADRIAKHRPQVVGYSAVSGLMFAAAAEVHALVESGCSHRVACVFGGHFPTRRAEKTFDGCASAGWIVKGEGEPAFEGLLRHLRGEKIDLGTLPGLVTRCDGRAARSRPRSTVEDLDVFGQYEESWIETRLGPDEWSLVTSRGCTARCTFCVIGPHWRRYAEWRGHSADWIAERIVRLRDRGARSVQIVDDQFVGSKASIERAWRICELLAEEPDLPRLSIMCRPDTVVENADLFAALRDLGVHSVFMGIETGSNEVAARFRKGTTAETGARAVGILHGLGIEGQSGTIVFHPWMTPESLRCDIQYFRDLMDAYPSFRILGLNELDILPGTPIAALHGADGGEWQRDWTKDDRPVYAIYRRWLAYQKAILFPAMEAVSNARNRLGQGAHSARLQLDALEHLLDACEEGVPETLSATILQMHASRFVARFLTGERLEEYLHHRGPALPAEHERELERCFDEG